MDTDERDAALRDLQRALLVAMLQAEVNGDPRRVHDAIRLRALHNLLREADLRHLVVTYVHKDQGL